MRWVSSISHKPEMLKKRGVLYLNPGSAGPRRFSLPVSLSIAIVTDEFVRAELRELVF